MPSVYTIIATDGKRHRITEDDVTEVGGLDAGAGETITSSQALIVNNGELQIGRPAVFGATVTATVEKEGKVKKVIVYKYKRKAGYHERSGHRQLYTQVKIEETSVQL